MANYLTKNGDGVEALLKATGDGTDGNPHVIEHLDTNSAAALAALQAIQAATEALDSTTLPTGAATAVKQDTANTSLASLETKLGEVQASPTSNTVLDRLKAITTALAGTLTVAAHAVTQSGVWNVTNVSGTVSLPTGAATAAKQPALGTAGSASTDVITVQGIASGVAQPVTGTLTAVTTVGTVTNVVHVDDNAGSLTVDGTVSVTGVATAANQSTANTSLGNLETKIGEVQASPTANTVLDRLKTIATALAGTLTVATHAVTQSGTWTVQPGNTVNTTPWLTKAQRSATPTISIPAGSTSSTTLLALNTNRLGATIHNDSAVALYVKLGSTASTTSFTIKMAADSYYEVPFNYTGVIDGIWASATGAARVTELV
jgi:hypothetical protein